MHLEAVYEESTYCGLAQIWWNWRGCGLVLPGGRHRELAAAIKQLGKGFTDKHRRRAHAEGNKPAQTRELMEEMEE